METTPVLVATKSFVRAGITFTLVVTVSPRGDEYFVVQTLDGKQECSWSLADMSQVKQLALALLHNEFDVERK